MLLRHFRCNLAQSQVLVHRQAIEGVVVGYRTGRGALANSGRISCCKLPPSSNLVLAVGAQNLYPLESLAFYEFLSISASIISRSIFLRLRLLRQRHCQLLRRYRPSQRLFLETRSKAHLITISATSAFLTTAFVAASSELKLRYALSPMESQSVVTKKVFY